MNYEKYILRCLELARLSEYYVAPNPMVGAVLVRNSDECVLSEGWHEQYGAAHAEVNCLRAAERLSDTIDYSQCTLFVNLEPCSHYGKTPPCAELIIKKGIGRVVVGMLDPNPMVAGQGIRMLQEAGIEVVIGVHEKECRELNKRFVCLHEKKRPYVILKWAQTADGFIDTHRKIGKGTKNNAHLNGALSISTPETKKIVHRMRAENMAIMVGTRTVLLDNPRLLNTHWEGRHPIRITLDRHNILPTDSRIFSDESKTIVYRDRTDWPFILEDLSKYNIHSVLVEGGSLLHEHILQTELWDEIHIEIAPEIVIGDGVRAPRITLPNIYEMVDGHRLYTIK